MSVDVKKYNFGIIGMGFLGNAITHGFGLHANIKAYDKYKKYDSFEDTVKNSDFIWLCLPTPMNESDGSIDLSIIHENLSKINKLVDPASEKIVIIKSTVIPGTTSSLSEQYKNVKIIYNPEFLTQRNNKLDFICASRIVLGGDLEQVEKVEEVYRYRFGNSIPIYKTSSTAAEMVKYGSNCFFATKISYFNLIYNACEKLNLDFDQVRDMILADGRIARSHANVPGWDGQRGWGGHCFVKDVNAFVIRLRELGVDPGLLEAAWEQNLHDRPSRDWEQLGPSVITRSDKNTDGE